MEKKFINCFKVILSCLALFSITACNNFIKGDEIADQIRTSIDYANSSSYLVKVAYKEGTGNVIKPASGESYQKQSDTFDIKFEANTEYQFIYWEVSSDKLPAGQDINDYVQIQDPTKSESSVKFKKGLENVIFTPVIMERPRALSCTPMSTGTLALRDSKIQVIFNRNMDPSSIYYTKQEVWVLIHEKGVPTTAFLPANAPIPTSPTTEITKIYGYKTINDKDEEEYIYKNILITDNEAQKNINKCFLAPYFKSPTTLIIPADFTNGEDNLPPAYGQIAVVLDKNFCYNSKINGKDEKINMGQKKDWIYQVNDERDSVFPTISKCILKYINADNFDPDGEILPSSDSNKTPEPKNLNYMDTGAMLIYLDITAGDEGSGLEPYFEVEFTKLQDKYYSDVPDPSQHTKIFRLSYMQQNDTSSSYTGQLDLSNFEDGVYRIEINVSDKNTNITTLKDKNTYYYFSIDSDIYLEKSNITIDDDPNTDKGLKISWSDRPDLKNATIKWKNKNDSVYSNTIEIQNPGKTNSTTISSLDYETDYDFKFVFYDYKGCYKEVYTESYTRPKPPACVNIGTIANNEALITITRTGGTPYGRYRLSNATGTKTSSYKTFDFENYAAISISITSEELSEIQTIGQNSGPYLCVQTKFRNKYSVARTYKMTLYFGNQSIIHLTEQ